MHCRGEKWGVEVKARDIIHLHIHICVYIKEYVVTVFIFKEVFSYAHTVHSYMMLYYNNKIISLWKL